MNLIVSLFGAGIHSQSDVNLESIGKARGGFLSTWFAKAIKATRARQGYPLSQYQKQVAEAGHLDAYSHWLFSKESHLEHRALTYVVHG